MNVLYFPGCTLKNKAKQLDVYARACAALLGVTVEEPSEWQCCGGAFTSASDEIATKLSAVRLLNGAAARGIPLVTVCAACHNVIRQSAYAMRNDPVFADRVKCYLAQENAASCGGDAQVYHYLELLRDVIGFDAVGAAVKKPLTGKRIAAYYGCLLLRPSKILAMDDPENPCIMEDLLTVLGAEPVIWARRNECCGGYTAALSPAQAEKNSRRVTDNALACGAEMIVTACPLCKYNLERQGCPIPVVYFTELLARAFGITEVEA